MYANVVEQTVSSREKQQIGSKKKINSGSHNIWQRQLVKFNCENRQKVTPSNQEAYERLAETEYIGETKWGTPVEADKWSSQLKDTRAEQHITQVRLLM